MQYMRSTGRSRIKIQGVEMGRIRVGFRGGFRDQGAELGRFRYVRWEDYLAFLERGARQGTPVTHTHSL